MRSALLAAVLLLAASGARSQSLAGDWTGDIAAGGTTLTFVFHVTPEADGFVATMDVPAQGAFNEPVRVEVSGDSVLFDLSIAKYEGVHAGDEIVGEFKQGSGAYPLTLARASGGTATAPSRPQTPKGPFPYAMEDVAFESASGVTLAGTITIPEGTGPFPGVVLVSGSGAQDRDSNVLGHRIFAVWADRLARAGIASIRYDERGVGKSTGSFAAATTRDFADDARAAADALGARTDVSQVGVLGHSEGGAVAPLVAGDSEAVAFVVLLAGPSVPGSAVLPDQAEVLMAASGADAAAASAYARGYRDAFAPFLASDTVTDEVKAAMRRAFVAAGADLDPALAAQFGLTEAAATPLVDALAAQLDDPWWRHFAGYDPVPALQALRVPTLAVYASLDLQVTPRLNLAPMREALAASASPNHSVVVFDGLNHLLQPATTGSDSEYAEIETTVSEEVLDLVTTWIVGATE